jgi:uncharacterized protein YggT (Ycf19 family)
MLEIVYLVLRYTIEFFLWFMIGRVVLSVLSGGKTTFFTELFRKATFPVFWLVRRITPSSVGDQHIPILSVPLLIAIYIILRPAPPAGGA